jgi:hypothetical protein
MTMTTYLPRQDTAPRVAVDETPEHRAVANLSIWRELDREDALEVAQALGLVA